MLVGVLSLHLLCVSVYLPNSVAEEEDQDLRQLKMEFISVLGTSNLA